MEELITKKLTKIRSPRLLSISISFVQLPSLKRENLETKEIKEKQNKKNRKEVRARVLGIE